MKKKDLIFSVISIIIGIYVLLVVKDYPRSAAYGTGVPGPGLWPGVIAVVIIFTALLVLLKALRAPESDTGSKLGLEEMKRVAASMLVLVVYVAILPYLGFIISSAIMMTIFISRFTKLKLLKNILVSSFATLSIYLVFRYVLSVPVDFGLFYL